MVFDAFRMALPMGIGLALSPIPLLALLIILMTANARRNSISFFFGWVAGILAVGALVYYLPSIVPQSSESSATTEWIKVAFGILLLIGAIRQFQKRPKKGEAPNVPRIITRLDSVGVRQSAITGFVLSGLNIKNVMFIGGGTAAIALAPGSMGIHISAFLLFTLLGSSLVILPIILYLLFGHTSEEILLKWRTWLSHHVQLVLALLLLVIAVMLFAQSLPALL